MKIKIPEGKYCNPSDKACSFFIYEECPLFQEDLECVLEDWMYWTKCSECLQEFGEQGAETELVGGER